MMEYCVILCTGVVCTPSATTEHHSIAALLSRIARGRTRAGSCGSLNAYMLAASYLCNNTVLLFYRHITFIYLCILLP